jgi:hypothetical protein
MGAVVSMAIVPPVGRDPLLTAVFCGMELCFGGITPPLSSLNIVVRLRERVSAESLAHFLGMLKAIHYVQDSDRGAKQTHYAQRGR